MQRLSAIAKKKHEPAGGKAKKPLDNGFICNRFFPLLLFFAQLSKHGGSNEAHGAARPL
jgi:hypothetical protein